MKPKGFMFSIEMLAVMSVVIVVVASIASFSTEAVNDTNIFEIKNANKAVIALYKSSAETLPNPANENNLCRSIADYDTDLNKIVEKRQCGWD